MSGIKNKQLDHEPHTVTITDGAARVSTRDGVDHRATQSANTTYTIDCDDGEKMLLVISVETASTITFEGAAIVSGELDETAGATNILVFYGLGQSVKGWVLAQE